MSAARLLAHERRLGDEMRGEAEIALLRRTGRQLGGNRLERGETLSQPRGSARDARMLPHDHSNAIRRVPRERALGRQLRAEEQEYVDALTKAIRGLGGDAEAEAEKLDFSQVTDQAAFLALAYDLESAARDFYVDQAAHLYTAAPRTLDAWLAAGHGGHVAMLPGGGG